MLVTHGTETYVVNYTRPEIPFVSWVWQLLFWQFIPKVDCDFQWMEGPWGLVWRWSGRGIAGTKEAGVTRIFLRVHVSSSCFRARIPWWQREIPWHGCDLAKAVFRKCLWVNLGLLHGPALLLLPPHASTSVESLVCFFAPSWYLLSSYCVPRTVPGGAEEIRNESNTGSPCPYSGSGTHT